MIKLQTKEKALIKDLQTSDTLNPFSEESKKIIHNLDIMEYSELFFSGPVLSLFKILG